MVRRFLPYTVPQLPRKPTSKPAKRSAGATLPCDSVQPCVWQSLQLPTIVRYSPALIMLSAWTAGPAVAVIAFMSAVGAGDATEAGVAVLVAGVLAWQAA